MTHKSVLLDTSFFVRFLNEEDPLFINANGYFRYFSEKQIPMMISTISIAEYCVIGDINELPLKTLQIVPFNLSHAKRTGEFARTVFKNKDKLKLRDRNIIPNDTKLFSQADIEDNIGSYLTSDVDSIKVFNLLKQKDNPKFEFLDLRQKHSERYGLLDF